MIRKIMKSVQDIRTLSGRVDAGTIPYKAYMKLSILEMEKFRRGKEKQSALDRVHHIDQRFKDIEVERQEIMITLEARGTARRAVHKGPAVPEAAPRTTTGPFKIRY